MGSRLAPVTQRVAAIGHRAATVNRAMAAAGMAGTTVLIATSTKATGTGHRRRPHRSKQLASGTSSPRASNSAPGKCVLVNRRGYNDRPRLLAATVPAVRTMPTPTTSRSRHPACRLSAVLVRFTSTKATWPHPAEANDSAPARYVPYQGMSAFGGRDFGHP